MCYVLCLNSLLLCCSLQVCSHLNWYFNIAVDISCWLLHAVSSLYPKFDSLSRVTCNETVPSCRIELKRIWVYITRMAYPVQIQHAYYIYMQIQHDYSTKQWIYCCIIILHLVQWIRVHTDPGKSLNLKLKFCRCGKSCYQACCLILSRLAAWLHPDPLGELKHLVY